MFNLFRKKKISLQLKRNNLLALGREYFVCVCFGWNCWQCPNFSDLLGVRPECFLMLRPTELGCLGCCICVVCMLNSIKHCLSQRLGRLSEAQPECLENRRNFLFTLGLRFSLFTESRGWDLEVNFSLWRMMFWNITIVGNWISKEHRFEQVVKEVMSVPSLGTLKVRLDETASNLIEL